MAVATKFRMNPRIVQRLAQSGMVRAVLEAAGQIVETEAKRRAPYKTGNLRRSIVHEVRGRGKDQHAIVAATAHYAAFQEFGTSRHAAHPFLRPALLVLRRAAGEAGLGRDPTTGRFQGTFE